MSPSVIMDHELGRLQYECDQYAEDIHVHLSLAMRAYRGRLPISGDIEAHTVWELACATAHLGRLIQAREGSVSYADMSIDDLLAVAGRRAGMDPAVDWVLGHVREVLKLREASRAEQAAAAVLDETELEVWLIHAHNNYRTLLDNTRADGGCVHSEEDGICWQCNERMFVLTLLPVVKAIRDGHPCRDEGEA